MKKILGYILIIAGLCFSFPVFLMVSDQWDFDLTPFLFSHSISVALFGAGFYFITPKSSRFIKRGNLWLVYVFVLCGLLPVYGILSSILIFILQKFRDKHPPSIIEEVITVQDPSIFGKTSTKSKQIEILQMMDIEPFIDIFIKGLSEKKKSAIKLLQKVRSKKTIEILLIALNDPDIEVRLFAAGVIGAIEDEFDLEIKARQLKFNSMPYDRQVALDLASFYIRYAESGLPDQIIRNHYYEEAHIILQKLSKDLETYYLQAKTDLALGKYDIALQNIKECLKLDYEGGKYYELYMSILFEMGDHRSLVATIAEARTKNITGISNEVMDYWS